MRLLCLLWILSTVGFAQQPVLYYRGTVNAASLAPFGLPNAPIARGSLFTVFGENLGPAQSPPLAFPLSTTLGGVALTVTQSGVTTSAYPIFVSPGQINAIMPSTVKGGLATLRLTYNSNKSNAATIQISDAGPGIFAVSSGGYGPGIVQNYISAENQPVNSSVAPASPGQVIIIWGTGLGPVTFADNVAPTPGNVTTHVSVTIGGQPAAIAYAGRSPCCAGLDQVAATVPANAPLGCWVPVTINAGGWVSNTVTMAIAAPGASACSDSGNPLSAMVRTPGAQAYIDFERMNTIDNVTVSPPNLKTMDKLYTRFYTRPASPYNFDPYMSYPPSGACIVDETSGDAFLDKSLRGALPASASLNPQPEQAYNNGTQTLTFSPGGPFFSSTVAATVDSTSVAMNPLGAHANLTIDPSGPNQTVVPMAVEPPPSWTPPGGILTIPRNSPFTVNFTPGDPAAPTAILLYSYTAVYNATVSIRCLAASGAISFTIPADLLSQIPATYGRIDGSYVNLFIGTLGFNQAAVFSNSLAPSGIYLSSNWLGQAVVLQ